MNLKTFNQLLVESWRLYTGQFGVLLAAVVLLSLPFHLITEGAAPALDRQFTTVLGEEVITQLQEQGTVNWEALEARLSTLTIQEVVTDDPVVWGANVAQLLGWAANVLLSVIVVVMVVRSIQGQERVGVGEAFTLGASFFWKAFAAMLLATLITLPFLFLFIVPGIVVMILLTFASPELIVIGKVGPMTALRLSLSLVYRRFFQVLYRIGTVFLLVLLVASALYSLTEPLLVYPFMPTVIDTVIDVMVLYFMVFAAVYCVDLVHANNNETGE